MEFVEFKAKTKDEALTNASLEFGCPIESIEYEVVSEASKGFIGIGAKPCIIKARKKKNFVDEIEEYIASMLDAMGIEAKINIDYDDIEGEMNIDLEGSDMGILIGKRGQTLDALQYLIRLAVNKKSESYIKVKLDTENYRARRKETLENLAKNIAYKVKRTKRPVSLEPMNPFERRVIHSALQNDKFVTTHSEGEEPYRHVVVTLKRDRER